MCLLGLKQQRLIWAKCFVFLGFYIYTWSCIYTQDVQFPCWPEIRWFKRTIKGGLNNYMYRQEIYS